MFSTSNRNFCPQGSYTLREDENEQPRDSKTAGRELEWGKQAATGREHDGARLARKVTQGGQRGTLGARGLSGNCLGLCNLQCEIRSLDFVVINLQWHVQSLRLPCLHNKHREITEKIQKQVTKMTYLCPKTRSTSLDQKSNRNTVQGPKAGKGSRK